MRLAELTVRVNNKYEYVKQLCRDYLIADVPDPDLTVAVTDDEIAAEQTADFHDAYLESIAVYRKIAEQIIRFDGILLHGVVLQTKGTGIAFLARSGVGKTTHAHLWKKLLGDAVCIVNGDKPLLRFIDGTLYAYGTPWAGKEGEQINMRTTLDKIGFIERGAENQCVEIDKLSALRQLAPAVYMPQDNRVAVLDLMDRILSFARFYTIRCNTDPAAAQVAYEGMGL